MGVLYIVRQESLRTLHTSTLSCGLYTVCVCVCVHSVHEQCPQGLGVWPGLHAGGELSDEWLSWWTSQALAHRQLYTAGGGQGPLRAHQRHSNQQ